MFTLKLINKTDTSNRQKYETYAIEGDLFELCNSIYKLDTFSNPEIMLLIQQGDALPDMRLLVDELPTSTEYNGKQIRACGIVDNGVTIFVEFHAKQLNITANSAIYISTIINALTAN